MRTLETEDQRGLFDTPISFPRFGMVFHGIALTGWLRTTFVYGAALVFFALFAIFETSWSHRDATFGMDSIERVHPIISSAMVWGAFAIALTVLIVSAISFRTSWLRWPVIGLLIALIFYPCSVISHVLANLGPWTVHGQVQAEGGTKYVFCDSSFLQGQLMAIAEVRDVGVFTTSYRVLVFNNGDSPRSWASLIRPEKSSDEYGQLYICKGFLIGVRYDNRCFVAYDLKNKRAYGHNDVETLSPFMCLASGATPSEVDIARTCERIQEYAAFLAMPQNIRSAREFLEGKTFAGCPPQVELRAALASDSPSVAATAKRLLTSYDEARASILSRLPDLKREFDEVATEIKRPEPK